MERPSMILDVDGKQQLYEWKLGEYSSHVEPAFEFTRRYINELEAENAELRELVRWMYDRMDESCAVQYPYAPAPISYDRLMQALARARELGVEVSHG